SWAHNVDAFVKGERNTNYLYINETDAKACGLVDGDRALARVGEHSIEIPVKVDDDMMPGTIAIPHGWGHQKASGLSIASKTHGANINRLMPSGPDSIEPASGMSHMNGVVAHISAISN
ncbi:MAG: molybdopterin dinucleotide binding domain-containing protein, partial [Halioglobus sp.]